MSTFRLVVAHSLVPGSKVSNQALATDLCGALKHAGHRVDELCLPLPGHIETLSDHFAAFRAFDLSRCDGNPGDLLIALDLPAAFIRHPLKVLWLNRALGSLESLPSQSSAHQSLGRAARLFLPEALSIMAVSNPAAAQAERFTETQAEILAPPPNPGNPATWGPWIDIFTEFVGDPSIEAVATAKETGEIRETVETETVPQPRTEP